MDNQMEIAKHQLFADDELNVSDVKLYPGTSRDIEPQRMAEEVNKALAQLASGNYTIMTDDEY
ncbi:MULTISPECIES: hypothetical protein [unclassified Rhizobium]|uniref:hypothetical protein n=1 Tax=unclassified Rhizobium TaxID=2613769 RepID=UPI001AD9A3FB|nr:MULTISPECIES: hypothetical protein [unclassified Rhizobium]MBO9124833.1 hypothetical protein [Rhizobium sp. 16-488-2b]MBO9175417.1 hypothetical protein [Rhizobium sp. 16-488-2a]